MACLALSADGRFVVSGSGDGTIRMWDFQTGEQLRVLVGHESGIIALAVSPEGHRHR
jgi:WD40 repeat protein